MGVEMLRLEKSAPLVLPVSNVMFKKTWRTQGGAGSLLTYDKGAKGAAGGGWRL
jgi:hypothetical protein